MRSPCSSIHRGWLPSSMHISSPPGVAKLTGYQPFAAAGFAFSTSSATAGTARLVIILLILDITSEFLIMLCPVLFHEARCPVLCCRCPCLSVNNCFDSLF